MKESFKIGLKKIKKISIVAILIALSIFGAASIKGNVPVFNSSKPEMNNNVSLTFSVLGDIHGDTEKFQEAVRDLYRVRENSDALILNGDTVDEGLTGEYDDIKSAIKRNKLILPRTIIKNIGNHEFFDYRVEYNTEKDVKMYISRYLEFAGEKNVYHDTWIKGYHFISLGSENGNTKDFNSVKAYISNTQLKWFEEKLSENHVQGKPVFVFLHQQISTSMKGWIGTDQSNEIINILSKYPEAIVFTSHTHASLEVDNVKTNLPFTTVHTGAVRYTLLRNAKGEREKVDGNYGLYIEVEGNKTTIRGRDFKRRTWIFTKEVAPTSSHIQ